MLKLILLLTLFSVSLWTIGALITLRTERTGLTGKYHSLDLNSVMEWLKILMVVKITWPILALARLKIPDKIEGIVRRFPTWNELL